MIAKDCILLMVESSKILIKTETYLIISISLILILINLIFFLYLDSVSNLKAMFEKKIAEGTKPVPPPIRRSTVVPPK